MLAAYGGDVTKALEAAKHTTDELLNADIVTDWNSKAQSAVSNAKSDSSWDDVIRDALAGYSDTGYNGNDPILKMLSDLNQARASGMTAREFALNKGVPSTLNDADAAILDEFDFKLLADDAAKSTESDWDSAFKDALADQANTGGGAGAGDNLNFKSWDDFSGYIQNVGKDTKLTIEEKVSKIQNSFIAVADKTDINIPIDAKYLKGFTADGKVVYDWPNILDLTSQRLHQFPETIYCRTFGIDMVL